MPYKGGVQLLPETQRRPTLRSYTSGNSYFYFAVFLGAVILVVSATLGGYKASLLKDIERLDGQMSVSESARNKDQERQLIAASKQSKIMKQLLGSKLYWSQALQRIEQMMQVSVQMTRIEADSAKGIVAFQARTDSYASVARQLAAFVSATGVKDITVENIESTSEGAVEFSGELVIDTKSMLMKDQPATSRTPTPTP
jgi:hypothetical protein